MYEPFEERSEEDGAAYTLALDLDRRILRLSCRGVWRMELAEQYRAGLRRAVALLRGKPWVVVADIRTYPPQSSEVSAVHSSLMSEAVSAGMLRAANVVTSALTQLQIARLAEEGHMAAGFFNDEASATTWALSALTSKPSHAAPHHEALSNPILEGPTGRSEARKP